MTTAVVTARAGSRANVAGLRRFAPLVGLSALIVLGVILRSTGVFPTNWNMNLRDPIDHFQSWIIDNKATHPVWRYFFTPISDFIESTFDRLADELQLLPWYALPLLVFAVIGRTRQWTTAVVAALLMIFPGAVGLWEPTMETLALLLVAVAICVFVGVPLGVVAALSKRFDSFLRPVLDAMQTVPSTVYLVPSILFFSIGKVPAAVSLVLFALPPVVRLTSLGIRGVPSSTVDAGHIFGSSRRQLLTKVQLPQAVPSIMTGINQTINLGIGIVVIAALIGAGGLGQEALESLRQRAPGRGLVIGAALVALAIVLDRISRSFVEPRRTAPDPNRKRWVAPAVSVGVVAVAIVGRAADWTSFPVHWGLKWADPFDDFLTWIRDHFRDQITWINDHFVRDIYIRIGDWLISTPWPVIVLAAVLLAWWVKGWRLALFFGISTVVIGLTGFWAQSLQTTVQVILATAIAMVIALPLGIWAGRRPRVEQVMLPILDALQTVPSLLYAIIFVYLIDVQHGARRHHRDGPVRNRPRHPRHSTRHQAGSRVGDRSRDDVRSHEASAAVRHPSAAGHVGTRRRTQSSGVDHRVDGDHRRAHWRWRTRLRDRRRVHRQPRRQGLRGCPCPCADGHDARSIDPSDGRTLPPTCSVGVGLSN